MPSRLLARWLIAGLSVSLALAACGGGTAHTVTRRAPVSTRSAAASNAKSTPRALAPARPDHFVYRHAYQLPAPLRDPAYASLGQGRFVLIGGLDAADVSTDEVDLGGLGSVSQVATIGTAQHDAQAALLGSKVYVFGGGSFSELSHIFSFDPRTRQITTVSNLPTASSDSSVATAGDTAYIVGGYDGTHWLDTVLSFTPSDPTVKVVARLPIGLRYAAVAVAGSQLIVIGGTTPTGVSDAVFGVDLATGAVAQIARLAAPICHTEAVTLGRYVYVVGGRGDLDDSQTAAILAIEPRTGRISSAGSLPVPLSDAAVIPSPQGILVIGGLESSGAVNQNVGLLRPAGISSVPTPGSG